MTKPVIIAATAMCLFWLLPPSQPSITAYDCDQAALYGTHETLWSLKELIPCETIYQSNFRETDTKRTDVIVRVPLKTVNAYHCNVSFTRWIVDSVGMKRKTVSNESQIIGREACLEAHNSKTIVLLGQLIPFLNSNGTIEHTVTNIDPHDVEDEGRNDTARGYHYERTYQITLSREQGDVDFKRDIVKFGSVACDFSELQCEDPNLSGELYWKSERGGEVDTKYGVDVQFMKRDGTELSPEVTYAVFSEKGKVFVLKTLQNETYDDVIEFQTDVDHLYIRVIDRFNYFGTPFLNHRYNDYFETVEKKLQNAYSEATGFYKFDAVEVAKRLCKIEMTNLVNSFKAPSIFPNVSSPQKVFCYQTIVFQYDYLGEHMYRIEPCSKIRVSLRETKECFEKIPVKGVHGFDQFLDPFLRISSDSANRIECSELSQYNENMENTKKNSEDLFGLTYASNESYKTSAWISTILIYSALLLLLI